MSEQLQTIEGAGHPIHFNQKATQMLNKYLSETKYSKLFIIVDSNTNNHCLPLLLPTLKTTLTIEIIEFEAGEINKNIETCVQIWNVLTELGADRKSLVINLGGGVVTDLGGFVASTFKRGIDFINIPTTLLSMVDASVGGKNGVDLGNLKNQVGVFNLPKMVLVCTEYLATMPDNEMRSGLAEMLKHGLIYDANYWEAFLDFKSINYSQLDSLIHRSVAIKNEIVTIDPTEQNLRKALNFGHTLGHAIESYFLESSDKTTLLHGEAIAIGMILESYISWKKELITEKEYLQIKNNLQSIYKNVEIDKKDITPILELMVHDKKNEFGLIQFALIEGIGKIKINQLVENKLIEEAFSNYQL